KCDWSSDVCSSDLFADDLFVVFAGARAPAERGPRRREEVVGEALEARALGGAHQLRGGEGEAAPELVEHRGRALVAQLAREREPVGERRAVEDGEPGVREQTGALGRLERR